MRWRDCVSHRNRAYILKAKHERDRTNTTFNPHNFHAFPQNVFYSVFSLCCNFITEIGLKFMTFFVMHSPYLILKCIESMILKPKPWNLLAKVKFHFGYKFSHHSHSAHRSAAQSQQVYTLFLAAPILFYLFIFCLFKVSFSSAYWKVSNLQFFTKISKKHKPNRHHTQTDIWISLF